MCKARIEKAVKVEGITSADWSTKTKLLTVTFDPSKTNKDVLSQKLASVGHDTEKYKATNDAYANLPGCCQYERSK
jgi:copper chaperone CopZ